MTCVCVCVTEQNAPQGVEQGRPVQRSCSSSAEAGRRQLVSGEVHVP